MISDSQDFAYYRTFSLPGLHKPASKCTAEVIIDTIKTVTLVGIEVRVVYFKTANNVQCLITNNTLLVFYSIKIAKERLEIINSSAVYQYETRSVSSRQRINFLSLDGLHNRSLNIFL